MTAARQPARVKAARGKCASCTAHGTDGCPECRAAELGEGQQLPASVRGRMEQGFGSSLPPDVRVHDDAHSHAMAADAGVRAFAVGHDIGVSPGLWPPSSLTDEAVLSHEIAHTMQYSGSHEPGVGGAGHEADADRAAVGVVARLAGVGTAAPDRPRASSGLALHGCDGKKTPAARPGQGLDAGLAAGQDTKGYTLDRYIELWEKQQGRAMTPEERKRLAAGCVGVTRTNLGGSASTSDCYRTFEQAKKRADELELQVGVRPYIFSKRFWSMGKPFPTDAGGKVDMSNDTGDSPAGEVNFDYGWWDEKSDTWWHANHCDPLTGSASCKQAYPGGERMKVYQSTLKHYSDPNYFGADQQVFCVAWSKL